MEHQELQEILDQSDQPDQLDQQDKEWLLGKSARRLLDWPIATAPTSIPDRSDS